MNTVNLNNELRADLPELPARMRHLPVDSRGYPVPWFVAIINGVPDFRVIRPAGVEMALKCGTCWLCGGKLGTYKAFVIGPMCAITRTTSEPACHRECAEFALRACPFMINPKMVRSPRDLPEQAQDPAGIMIDRNPGVSCLWITKEFSTFEAGGLQGSRAGMLIEVGEPTEVLWWAQARAATRAEVQHSIDTGFPALEKSAAMDKDPAAALVELLRCKAKITAMLPAM